MSETSSREHRQSVAATLTVSYGLDHPMSIDETLRVYSEFVSRLNTIEGERARKREAEEERAKVLMPTRPNPNVGIKTGSKPTET